MAWRSSGSSNIELVENLSANGLIKSSAIRNGFQNVDRKYFVPKELKSFAYADEPLKAGNVHISAPHIYCYVLEALELHPNASLSFLNIGMGTGYLTCLAAEIMGPNATYFGVEIDEDVIEHCRDSIDNWLSQRPKCRPISTSLLNIFLGNGLDISSESGEGFHGFDRVYVGGGIDRSQLTSIELLLCSGGILVAPVDDELVKVTRSSSGAVDGNEFKRDVISNVGFAPLKKQPNARIVIPALTWEPVKMKSYPLSFRKSAITLLMCSNSQTIQPFLQEERHRINVSSKLPREVWVYILSFMPRKWFEPQESETEQLKKKLRLEQIKGFEARKAADDAKAVCCNLEHERDFYRHLSEKMLTCLKSFTQYNEMVGDSANQNFNHKAIPAELFHEAQSIIDEINNRNSTYSQSSTFVPSLRYFNDDDDDGLSLAEDDQSTSTNENMVEDLIESNDDSSVHAIDDGSLSTDMSVESDLDIDSRAETQSLIPFNRREQRQSRTVSICEDV